MYPLWNADLGDGQYRNPVLHTDYSDPDVIRVGEDYYMISSSFTYIPGVPLLHSKDLVNWERINYIVREIPLEQYSRPNHGSGVWAPSLRYEKGIFYAFIPLPDEGIFVSAAKDPYGEWSKLRCIKEAKGWIDPCPLWDEDGKAYMVFAYARSRCQIKHRLSICEMDLKAERLLSEPVLIYDGIQENPTIEGPKLYKKNGWYYIFAPAGGVAAGWQTVLRSRNIYGPYEAKIVLHQGNTQINGPHQGGYVETPEGKGFFLHFQDAGPYGRIVHLQPVCWHGGWPFIGQDLNGDAIGEPVPTWEKPSQEKGDLQWIYPNDDFAGETLSLCWQWQANPDPSWYSLKKEPGTLALYCRNNPVRSENYLWYAPNACTQMLPAPRFLAETKLTLHAVADGDFAGVGILGHTYSYLGLELRGDRIKLLLRTGCVTEKDYQGKADESIIWSGDVPKQQDTVWIRLVMRDEGKYQYFYSWNGTEFTGMAEEFQAVKASWTGAKFTLYSCNTKNQASAGYGSYGYVAFQKL